MQRIFGYTAWPMDRTEHQVRTIRKISELIKGSSSSFRDQYNVLMTAFSLWLQVSQRPVFFAAQAIKGFHEKILEFSGRAGTDPETIIMELVLVARSDTDDASIVVSRLARAIKRVAELSDDYDRTFRDVFGYLEQAKIGVEEQLTQRKADAS